MSGRIPSAMMLQPERAKSCCCSPRRASLFHSPGGDTDVCEEDFVTAPSIPQPHVPHSTLRHQVSSIGATTQWRHLSQPLGGLTFPSSYSTATSLRLLSPGYVMCDMPKNVSIELVALLLLIIRKKNIANSYRYRNG